MAKTRVVKFKFEFEFEFELKFINPLCMRISFKLTLFVPSIVKTYCKLRVDCTDACASILPHRERYDLGAGAKSFQASLSSRIYLD